MKKVRTRLLLVAALALIFSAVSAQAATITVTSSADAGGTCPGACTLRQAIATAAAGDTILFNIPTFDGGYNAATQVFTITLTSGELAISKNVTIDGGANKIVVARSNAGGTPLFRILNVTSGTVSLARLTITGGIPPDTGGGVRNAGDLTLSACTILNNGGGAVANSGTMVLSNCTIAFNGGDGGTSVVGSGLDNAGNATLNSCTIFGNNEAAGTKPGVVNSGTAHVRNTVIAGNRSGSSLTSADVAGDFISDGYNFIGVTDGSTGFGAAGSHDQTGTKAAGGIGPQFSALRDNGGVTKTLAPLSGSTLIDQGSSGGLTTDQRGDPRPVGQANVAGGDGSDIGAVERGPSQFPNSGPNLTVTNTDEHNEHECRADDCTLAAAIEAGNFIAANASLGPVTIKFAPGMGGVILNTQVAGGLNISAALNIVGPGARVLTISGNNVSRVFNITGGTGNMVNISGLTIANANSGSGVTGGGISNSANLNLRDCAVLNNSGGSGGGAANLATMHVTNCTFAGNQSTGNGAALRNVGDLVVTNSTFNNNTAVFSGAIASFVSSGPAATLNIINCTISGNTASDTSGGTGGGILNGNLSTATVNNTIVANNTAAIGTDVSGPFTSGGHNLIRIATGSTGFTNGNNGDQVGIPAGLDTLKNNGGPTDTMALLSGSTATNNGGTNAPSTDQRGAARVGASDIGAFEFNGIPPAPPTVTTNAATNVGTTSATLNATVNPNGLPTSFYFTSDFASFPAQDAGSGTTSVPFTVNVTGLAPNTQYHFNTVAMSNGVIAQGTQQTFITLTSSPTPTPTATPGSLGNISTRLQVLTGNNVLFAGFIIQGSASKTVLIRSAGPSLTAFGLPGAMSNPQLELHDANNTIGTNDNWQTTQLGGVITSDQVAAIQNSGAAPSDPMEPAIIATLPAGSYTAIVQGVGGTQGVATVEVYDLSPNNGATLANISTRGFIQTGDNVMIGGFIDVGQSSRVLIRATGPSLAAFGIANPLANPRIELHDANGTLAGNDDWQTTQLGGIITSDQSAAIQNSGLAPSNPAESAIIATLAPGSYTAIAQGVNGGTGVGVIEVFALP